PAHSLGRIGVTRGLRVRGGVRTIHAQLGEVARGLLEGRPIPFLLSGQRKTCLERGESRFAVGAQVLDARTPSLRALTARSVLRIDQRAARNQQCGCACCDWLPHLDYPSTLSAPLGLVSMRIVGGPLEAS